MLGYRHGFHAGNFADVVKHSVLVMELGRFVLKDSPFLYFDTHGGGGIYDLDSQWGETGEAERGVKRLFSLDLNGDSSGLPEPCKLYLDTVKKTGGSGSVYPGSPLIASYFLREQDYAVISELHPRDFESLENLFRHSKNIHLHFKDGFERCRSLLPPRGNMPKRGLLLIDPSYELPEDYSLVQESVKRSIKNWTAGTLLLWYPLIERRATLIDNMKSGIIGIAGKEKAEWLDLELAVRKPGVTEKEGHQTSLYGTGMIIVRPGWKTREKLEELLPFYQKIFAEDDCSYFKIESSGGL